jgi:hypothetical protein
MTIDLLFLAYNRLDYTKLALSSLLADPTEEFSLTIWDNDSRDGTRDYLSSVDDPRIMRKVFARKNVYLDGAANNFLSKSSADLVGIIPNDFLVTPGWTRPLARAHADVAEFGMIGCWHFFPDDFDYEQAKHKIQRFGQHQVLRHPWTGGGAGLVKLKTVRDCGPLEPGGTTNYWIRMALRGYVNGFYFPLIYVEHMDDPRSKYSRVRSMSFEEAYKDSPGYQAGTIRDLQGYKRLHEDILDNLLSGPYDPKYYCGWRAKARHAWGRIKNVMRFSAIGSRSDGEFSYDTSDG